jgi:hypothetical protein
MTTRENLDTSKKTARIVGALFLFSNITFIVGAVMLVEPIINAPNYLSVISNNSAKVVLGVLLEITNAVAYMGIAVLMYPVVRQRFESLALGYVSFRIVEFVMQILSSLSPLALISLGEGFLKASATEVSSFQPLGALLIAERTWAFQMVSITFGLGALLFYIMLYQSKLIPRFISVWGLIGATFVLGNVIFDMFGLSIVNLGVLMLLNEMFLGVWLIIKGFNPSASVSRFDKQV